jgi:hypothetical protein
MPMREHISSGWTLDEVARPWRGVAVHRSLVAPDQADSGHFCRDRARDLRSVRHAFVFERLKLTRMQAALTRLLDQPTAEALTVLYGLATAEQLIGSVDERCTEAEIEQLLEDPRVQAVGRVLAREAPHGAAVGLGVVLLSRASALEDQALLLELGQSDVLAACVAAALASQGTHAVFVLAQRTRGRARCAAIEWLADTESPEICGWLLREGALDAEHHQHIAYLCASAGRLDAALAAEHVDAALLAGAGRLLYLLATSLSAPDMADYDEVSSTVAAFLRHLEQQALTPDVVSTLEALAECPDVPSALATACRARVRAGSSASQAE